VPQVGFPLAGIIVGNIRPAFVVPNRCEIPFGAGLASEFPYFQTTPPLTARFLRHFQAYVSFHQLRTKTRKCLWLVSAMCGRLRVGKDFLHARRLVGAAMCSAFSCGSHDRWP